MVRKATVWDADTIFKIESSAIECAWTAKQIKEAILDDNYIFFVYEIDGAVVSYGGVRIVIDEAEICNIATLEGYRRRGFADKILFELEKYCFEHGVKGLFLEVNSENCAAIGLYKRAKFKNLSIRKNYYKSGDACIMVKELKKITKR